MFFLAKSAGCPSCGSASIRRSRRKGLLEFLLHHLLRIDPYRCRACYERYFRLRHPEHHPDPATPKHAH